MKTREDIDSLVGSRITIVREKLGLSRADLEARTGITRARLGTYERGEVSLRVEPGLVLCRGLNANPFFIAGFEPFWKGHCFKVERAAAEERCTLFADLIETLWKNLGPNAYAVSVVNRMCHFEENARDQLRAAAELMNTIRQAAEEVDPKKRSDALKEISRLADRIATPLHAASFNILTDFNNLQDTIWGLTLRALRSEPVKEEKAHERVRPLPAPPPLEAE